MLETQLRSSKYIGKRMLRSVLRVGKNRCNLYVKTSDKRAEVVIEGGVNRVDIRRRYTKVMVQN